MKKICVVTATRAEYGYLRPLLNVLRTLPEIKAQLLVTGTHLDKRYGNTVKEIKADGITPDAQVRIIANDTREGILQTMANALTKVGATLRALAPDMVVLLGDRYEIFAIAAACVIQNIPIAHISGGDVTYGAYDDMFRHSLTKMSNMHFTSCEAYRRRVIQLGENPQTVFNVGSLSLENLSMLKLLSKEEINTALNIDVENTLLATFHPVTMETATQQQQFTELLAALCGQKRYFTLFTRANADTDAQALNALLDHYCARYPDKIKAVESLGTLRYFSVMRYCAGVVGNSSSGILEAPSFKVATINIGNRQQGRMQAASVLNCSARRADIARALARLHSPDWQKSLNKVKNPYAGRHPAEKIAAQIVKFLATKPLPIKKFYDLPGKI